MTDHKPLTAAQIAEIEAKTADERKCARIRGHNDACVTLSCDDADALVRDLRAAREALMRLSNEVIGSVPMMEVAARQAIGNTNYNVLMLRAEEARAALPEETPNGS